MKKNISINIGGIIFHIEEDGYDKLKNYLDSVNKYFSSFEDSKEIIEDIEGRIAEIFLTKLDDGKQIITLVDIDDLMATMGTTKDFDATIETEPDEEPAKEEAKEEPKDTSGEDSKSEEKSTSGQSKRLYRDNSRRVIGGVASGMANYFGIDPIWIRLIMLAFLFNIFFWGLSGFIFITYIILWIAIPGSDKLEDDKTIKKLYRSSEDRVLGGVSGGIAAYFGVDVVLVRVLFVISIFLGAGIFIYLILWIITPEARTITEKMQMQGEPVTISNIEENVKKSLNVQEGEENVLVKILLFPFRLIAMIFKSLGEILGPLLKFAVEALRIAVGVFFVFLGFVLMVSFTITLAVLLGIGGAMESWVHFGDFPVHEFFNSMSTIAIVSSYFVSMVPSLAISLLGLVIILKRRVTSAFVAWSLFGLWLLGMIGVAISVPTIVRNYSAEGTFKEERTYLVQDATPTLRLNDMDLDSYNSVDLRVRGHEEDTYMLALEFESRGRTRTDARENAEAVDYEVISDGEDFIFDSDISFDDAPFRFQDVSATFYIPYGKVFRMDYDLRRILRNSLWMYDYSAYDMEDNEWVFEESGRLNCITCDEESEREPSTYNYRYERGSSSNDYMEYDLENFDEVRLISLFDFDIRQGDEYSVRLEGDDDKLDEVYVKQEGDELEIRYGKDWDWWKNANRKRKVKVFIEMPRLEYLKVSGACEGDVRDFDNSDISFDIIGASQVWAEISPKYLGLDLSGASKLILVGDAKELEVDLIGASELDAFNFSVEDVDVNASGASSAKVYASNELSADASGASSIRYRGSARVSSDSNGLSSIKRD